MQSTRPVPTVFQIRKSSLLRVPAAISACLAPMCLVADDASLLAKWSFESTLGWHHAAPGLAVHHAHEVVNGNARYTGDRSDGNRGREYTANLLATSLDASNPTYVDFHVGIPMHSDASTTLNGFSWQAKARSFVVTPHNNVRLRLYWSVDDFSTPISTPQRLDTNQQLSDGTWVTSWVFHSADFAPLPLSAGQGVTFRLMMSAESDLGQKTLRLDDVRLSGDFTAGAFDPFLELIDRRRAQLTGAPFDDPSDPVLVKKLASLANTAEERLQSMDSSANRSYLWADLASTTNSGHVTASLNRLVQMAQAYSTPGCSKFGDAGLRDAILGGLDWMHANRYNALATEYGNWWHWQIGNTQALGNLLILMHQDLSMRQLADHCATLNQFLPGLRGWMTGANRSDKVLAAAMHGALAQNPALLEEARDELTPVFEYVTSGDGIYRDGSMIQHTAVPYTGSYGAELINGIADLYAMLSGTNWQLTDPLHLHTFDWIAHVFAPLYFRAAMPDHVRGRAIARPTSTDRATGHYMLSSMLRFANAAPTVQAAPIRAWIRAQADSDHRRNFATSAPIRNYQAAKDLVNDPELVAAHIGPGHFRFPSMDRVVHRRANYAYGLAMSSTRVYHYEEINGENLRGWFTGDGMLTLHNADLAQFEDGYWGTVDMYHLPGVTNSQASKTNSSGSLRHAMGQWVGGVDLGVFGSTGMHLRPWNDELQGRKSYFFFENEVVCLGSGISSNTSAEIHTTVENRRLSAAGGETLIIDGVTAPGHLGWNQSIQHVGWLNLAGTGGIVFPNPTNLHLKREARTGSYRDVNSNAADVPLTRNFFTAHINHGGSPSNASYAYVLLPDADAAGTADFAANPSIEILANTASLQAVRHHQLKLTNAHFWGPQGGGIDNLSVDGPAAVMLHEQAGTLEIAISDPTWQRVAPLTLTMDQSVGNPASLDPRITVIATEPHLVLEVNLAQTRGQSLRASFSNLIAKDDFYTIPPDSTVLMDVLANDSTLGTGEPQILSHSHGAFGQVTLEGNALRYTPGAGFTGHDSFIYQIGDGVAGASATVTLEVASEPGVPAIAQAIASTSQPPNLPENTLDGNTSTRWSGQGMGTWLALDLGKTRALQAISIAFFLGNERQSFFDLEHSPNGIDWTPISSGLSSSGTSLGLETFQFPAPVRARYIRYIGRGNTSSDWNSLTAVQLHPYRNQSPAATPIDLTTHEGRPVEVPVFSSTSDGDSWPSPLRILHLPELPGASFEQSGGVVTITPAPGEIGPMAFHIQLTDGHRAVNLPVHLVIDHITSWEGYRKFHFSEAELTQEDISGPLGNPNHSPFPNIVEFVLGNDPKGGTRPEHFHFPPPSAGAGGTSIVLLQTRRISGQTDPPAFSATGPSPFADIGGVLTHVEASHDLENWDQVSLTPVPLPDTLHLGPSTPEHQLHAFEVELGGTLFLRLRVERIEP